MKTYTYLFLFALSSIIFNSCCEQNGRNDAYPSVTLDTSDHTIFIGNSIEIGDKVNFNCEGVFEEESVLWKINNGEEINSKSVTQIFNQAGNYDYQVKYINGCDKTKTKKGSFSVVDYKRSLLYGVWQLIKLKRECIASEEVTSWCNGYVYDSVPNDYFIEFKNKGIYRNYNGQRDSSFWQVYEEIKEGSYLNLNDINDEILKLSKDTLILGGTGTSIAGDYFVTRSREIVFVRKP